MKCPKCSAEMVEIRQDDIYIDVCKECRGVFLDAGELDQLLTDGKPRKDHHGDHHYKEYNEKNHKDYKHHGEYYHDKKHYKYKKKSKMKSILGDIFDF